jgi:hypothetical protein
VTGYGCTATAPGGLAGFDASRAGGLQRDRGDPTGADPVAPAG